MKKRGGVKHKISKDSSHALTTATIILDIKCDIVMILNANFMPIPSDILST